MTSKLFKTFVFCLLLNATGIVAQARFLQASIGINGLTCSQCSRSVEIQLRKLSFIKEVHMDLAHTEGTILFKDNIPVDINAIARAVKDAGFSVRYLKADISKEDLDLSADGCFRLSGDVYYVVKRNTAQQSPTVTLQFLGKEYLSRNELKQYKLPAAVKCKGKNTYYTVMSRD